MLNDFIPFLCCLGEEKMIPFMMSIMCHNRTLLHLGGNPMMLDLKNVCLLFCRNGRNNKRELYHGAMVSYQKHGLSGRHQGESEQRISPPQHSESDSLWKRFDKTHLLSKLKIYFSYGTLLSEIAGPRSSCWNSHIKKKCPPKRNLSSSKTINTKPG